MSDDIIMNATAAAKHLGIGKLRLSQRKDIPRHKIGARGVYYIRAELDQFKLVIDANGHKRVVKVG